MTDDFNYAMLGCTGLKVFRLGLSASYRPGRNAVHHAIDAGINFFFCYGFDTHMTSVLRGLLTARRDDLIVCTGAYCLLVGHLNLRRTLEKRLRQLGTNYIDVFLYLGVMKPKHLGDDVLEEMRRFRDEGKVRAIGLSCHDRKFVGRLVADGSIDVTMMRYNAAHRGAEQDIFPHLAAHDPGVVSYTATRWGRLLRRPRGYPSEARVPSPDQCYRYVLSNPHVDVCLMAPSNEEQLRENLAGMSKGPLSREEMEFMQRFGDLVHRRNRWFM